MVNKFKKPRIKAFRVSLYPEMDSLDDVIDLAQATFPAHDHHALHGLFMTYQNTLLKQLETQ